MEDYCINKKSDFNRALLAMSTSHLHLHPLSLSLGAETFTHSYPISILSLIGLSIDESSLTGEQEPREKSGKALPGNIINFLIKQTTFISYFPSSFFIFSQLNYYLWCDGLSCTAGLAEDAEISERSNMAFMGSLVSSGHGLCLVTSTGLLTGAILCCVCVVCCN